MVQTVGYEFCHLGFIVGEPEANDEIVDLDSVGEAATHGSEVLGLSRLWSIENGEVHMIEVRQSITVKRSPGEVFAFWSDHSNNPLWQKGQRRCTWTSEPPIRVGSTYDQEATMMGRPIISSFECVEYEPSRLIRIKTTKSALPLDITREVEVSADGGTTLRATIRGEPQGFMKLFNPLTRWMVARNVRKDYENLKELLDGDADID